MLIKCNCNHCSTHLEFEAGNEGEIISCPSCGMDTKLYAPPPPPKPIEPSKPKPPLSRTIPDPTKETASRSLTVAEALNQIRVDSCYKTLRGLIDLLFFLYVGIASIVCLGCLVQAVDSTVNGYRELVKPVLILLGAVASVIIAVGLKQAALLLVDIADCQIQLARRGR